jgi:hypothetical protein
MAPGTSDREWRRRPATDTLILAALSAGATQAEAAKQARVSVRTVARRVADPEFQAQLTAVRDEARRRLAAKLTDTGFEAIDALRDLLCLGTEDQIRLGAVRVALDNAFRAHNLDTDARLAALEARDRDPTDPEQP